MPQVNIVVITGRLGQDPEVKYIPSGTAVTKFSIANNQGYGDNKKTAWIDVQAWAKTAEWIGENVHKGDEVFVEGVLQMDKWEGKDGTMKQRLYINCFRPFSVQLLSRKGAVVKDESPPWPGEEPVERPDDDIPF
jgi:single stranded DNA-binding protein